MKGITMANTRTSAKRARQAKKRQARNQTVKTTTRSALSDAITALKQQDLEKAKQAYRNAIRTLSKAASKGAVPAGRASRKISRLTLLAKKMMPTVLPAAKK